MREIMSKKPLHRIIYDEIVHKIENQFYQVGDILPSEAELEKLFNTSRTPVRQALKQLETDGKIYRHQGKGSFVANSKPIGQWTTMTGFKELYKEEWKKISARTIEVNKVKSPFYANLLEVNSDKEIIHLKRVRFFNGEPIIYLEHYLTPELPIEIFKKDSTFISIDQLLNEEQNIEFATIKEEIEAVSASKEVAESLKIEVGIPVLNSTRVSFDTFSKPIDVTVSYFRSEKWKYRIQFNKE
ncbi:GntR family transcriptional regulator [Peribacillus simplex]|uniref:GntR family transcriptional regulator n=1 Tax=Peribacillus simplex TaxID=1478 RepID=UPI0038139A65